MGRTTNAGSMLLFTLVAAGLAVGADAGPGARAKEARTRVVRTWLEPVTIGDQAVMQRISYVFDYDAGVFHRTVQDAGGRTLESKSYAPGEIEVRPSDEEIAEAMELVRSDAEFARIIDQTSARLTGGFILSEKREMPCGPGTRCLHVQLVSQDGVGLVRWVVPDLTKRGFAYRRYNPLLSEGGAR